MPKASSILTSANKSSQAKCRKQLLTTDRVLTHWPHAPSCALCAFLLWRQRHWLRPTWILETFERTHASASFHQQMSSHILFSFPQAAFHSFWTKIDLLAEVAAPKLDRHISHQSQLCSAIIRLHLSASNPHPTINSDGWPFNGNGKMLDSRRCSLIRRCYYDEKQTQLSSYDV